MRAAPLTIMIVVLTAATCFAQLSETRELTSNNIIALAGSGDTLWLATERGFNYQAPITPKGAWHGFEAGDLGGRLWGMAFGGGGVAAVVTNGENYGEIGFWHFSHASKRQQQTFFRYPRPLYDDGDGLVNPTGSVVYAHGCFWAAFGRGGIFKYDPRNNSVYTIRPGDEREVLPQNLQSTSAGDSVKIVTEVGVIPGGNLILAVTLSAAWTYDPAVGKWEKLDKKPDDDPVYKALDNTNFYPKLAAVREDLSPVINAMLFLPRGGGAETGILAIATTTGLYICQSSNPITGQYGEFTLVRNVREIKSGDAYALPGIVRSSLDGRYGKCVFVYKLKKDGSVTIGVYDYNMSLVKTVVKGASRRAGGDSERSTVSREDFWDGTNAGGKRVWPGVYYFKITSTGGDRLFGKIILAK